jgi:hypothetical protein
MNSKLSYKDTWRGCVGRYISSPPNWRDADGGCLLAVLITIYCVLFLLMSSCFFRLVFASPGYVPRTKDDPEKALTTPDPTTTADIFLCEVGGYPRWCRHCQVVKPDRAHHSKDCGRCTYKMGIDSCCSRVG